MPAYINPSSINSVDTFPNGEGLNSPPQSGGFSYCGAAFVRVTISAPYTYRRLVP